MLSGMLLLKMSSLKRFFLRLWQALGKSGTQFTILSGSATLIFILTQYLENQSVNNFNRSIQFLNDYDSKELIEARFKIDPAIQDSLHLHFSLLHRFYRNVSSCVRTERCDGEILCKAFFLDMQNFRYSYTDFFKELDDEWLNAELYHVRQFLEFCESNPKYLR